MKIVFRTIFRRLFKTFLALASVFCVLFLILFVRLLMGPIEIKPLTQFVLESLQDENTDMKIKFETAFLELGLKRGHLLDIKLTDVFVLRSDESVLANVPEANVSYSFLKLMKGQLIPSDIFIYRPYLDMNIEEKSSSTPKVSMTQSEIKEKVSDILRRIRKLDHFYIEDGDLSLHFKKQDTTALLDKLNFDFQRTTKERHQLILSGEYYQNDVLMPVNMKGFYDFPTKKVEFSLEYSNLDLSDIKKYVPLDEIDLGLKIKGTFSGILNLSNDVDLSWIEKLSFDVENAEEGQVVLTELQATYPIKSLKAHGIFSPGFSRLTIYPIDVDIYGQKGQAEIELDDLDKFLYSMDFNQFKMKINASIENVPMKKVPMLWPAMAGPDAHQWARENITKGKADKLVFTMQMKGEDILDLKTVIDTSGAEIIYWPTMPKVENGKAQVILQMGRVDIVIQGGTCAGAEILGGDIVFTDIEGDFPLGNGHLSFAGPASSVVSILSSDPVFLDTIDGVDWKNIKGQIKGKMAFTFPCEETDPDHFFTAQYKGTAEDVVFPVVDFVINEGTASFEGTTDDIQIEGKGLLNGSSVRAKIYENWSDQPKRKPSYQIWADLSPSFFKPYFPDVNRYLKGEARTKLELFFEPKDVMKADVVVNLNKAEYTLPIGYTKPMDVPSSLNLSLVFKKGEWASVPSLALTAEKDNVKISGHIDGGKDIQIKLDEIVAPKNDAKMSINIKDQGFDLDLSGKKINLEPVLHGSFVSSLTSLNQKQNKDQKQSFDIRASLDELYLSKDEKPLTSVSVAVRKENNLWTKFDGMGFADSPLSFSMSDDKKEVAILCKNIGSFLKRSGFTSRIDNGKLDGKLKQEKNGTLWGELNIKEFELTDTSFFLQAATILGVIDAFSGDKIPFNKAVIPIKLFPNNDIQIEEGGLASGRSVGITFQGSFSDDGVDLKGTIIPAYAVNGLIGQVPLIGDIITGEKGGGLVGLSYSVKGSADNPNVEFYPSTLFAPGFLKNLFN